MLCHVSKSFGLFFAALTLTCCARHVLFVHPDLQGRGVGRALLAHASALADAARVPLYLEASSTRAVAFYATHGFAQIRTLEIHYRGEDLPLPVLVREPVNRRRLTDEQVGLSVPATSPSEREGSTGALSPGWEVTSPESSGEKSDDSFVEVRPEAEDR